MVAGSSLVVSPANEMPRIALESGARLVIINRGETPLDKSCHLRFEEKIGEVLPPAVDKLRELIEDS
jgi:NAD-dependent deacetylase